MRIFRRHLIAGSAAVALAFVASTSSAQTVSLHLDTSEPTTQRELYVEGQRIGRTPPVAVCHDDCTVIVPPGRYRLRVVRIDGSSFTSRQFDVADDSSFRVTPPSADRRAAGLTMGIAGPALIVGGMIATMPLVTSSMCHDYNCGSSRDQGTLALVGLGLMGAGAIMTPIGWTMFARSLKGDVEREPEHDRTPPSPAFSFGFVPSGKNPAFVAAYRF